MFVIAILSAGEAGQQLYLVVVWPGVSGDAMGQPGCTLAVETVITAR